MFRVRFFPKRPRGWTHQPGLLAYPEEYLINRPVRASFPQAHSSTTPTKPLKGSGLAASLTQGGRGSETSPVSKIRGSTRHGDVTPANQARIRCTCLIRGGPSVARVGRAFLSALPNAFRDAPLVLRVVARGQCWPLLSRRLFLSEFDLCGGFFCCASGRAAPRCAAALGRAA